MTKVIIVYNGEEEELEIDSITVISLDNIIRFFEDNPDLDDGRMEKRVAQLMESSDSAFYPVSRRGGIVYGRDNINFILNGSEKKFFEEYFVENAQEQFDIFNERRSELMALKSE